MSEEIKTDRIYLFADKAKRRKCFILPSAYSFRLKIMNEKERRHIKSFRIYRTPLINKSIQDKYIKDRAREIIYAAENNTSNIPQYEERLEQIRGIRYYKLSVEQQIAIKKEKKLNIFSD